MTRESAIDEVSPNEAYEVLATDDGAALVDVRTRAEWDQVGVPDVGETGRPLWFVEWVSDPGRIPNPGFLQEILEKSGGDLPERILFICRSGARSAAAAQAVAALSHQLGQNVQCTNVAEGFEGAPAYGSESGWRGRGLPWKFKADRSK